MINEENPHQHKSWTEQLRNSVRECDEARTARRAALVPLLKFVQFREFQPHEVPHVLDTLGACMRARGLHLPPGEGPDDPEGQAIYADWYIFNEEVRNALALGRLPPQALIKAPVGNESYGQSITCQSLLARTMTALAD